jgi:hypothetical protein
MELHEHYALFAPRSYRAHMRELSHAVISGLAIAAFVVGGLAWIAS